MIFADAKDGMLGLRVARSLAALDQLVFEDIAAGRPSAGDGQRRRPARREDRDRANTGADEITSANVRNWMECVRSRKTPNAHIDAGYSHSIALCMAIAAMHTGRKATFDDARQEVVVSGGDARTTNEQARQ